MYIMNKLLEKLNIDETLTKPAKKDTFFTKINDQIPHKKHLNYMADILFLPHTKKDAVGLFVIIDLATHNFDIEPIKNHSSEEILKAYQAIIKRKYIKDPYFSIQTDNEKGFLGDFEKYLTSKDVMHKIAYPYRHKQMSMVERLNRTLGRLFNGYMNSQELKTGKVYKEWDDVINTVRQDLNEIIKRKEIDPFTEKYMNPNMSMKPKFKVGDMVNVKLEVPRNSLNNKQNTTNFRTGDLRFDPIPKTIAKIFQYFGDKVPFRYMIKDRNNVTYTENELKLSTETIEKYEVERFLKEKKQGINTLLLVKWKNFPVKKATWQTKTILVNDLGKNHFDELMTLMNK